MSMEEFSQGPWTEIKCHNLLFSQMGPSLQRPAVHCTNCTCAKSAPGILVNGSWSLKNVVGIGNNCLL